MPIRYSNPAVVASPVWCYSTLAEIPAGARVLALAGQVGNRPDGSFAESVVDQFIQALDNVLAIVTDAGGNAGSIARLTCFATEPADAAGMARLTEAFAQRFPNGFPAQTMVFVTALFAPHVKIEIEALAALHA